MVSSQHKELRELADRSLLRPVARNTGVRITTVEAKALAEGVIGLLEQLEALRVAHDLELDELRMQVVGAENDLREAEAIVKAAREYVGEEPVQLWLNRGDRLVGALADPKWKRLVVALADSYHPASEPKGAS